jgi:o-succinylbenzoate synthase
LRHRFEAAHAAIADREGVLLEVVDADGAHGIGEASPMPSLGDGSVDDVMRLLEAHAPRLLRDPCPSVSRPLGSARPSTGSGRASGGVAALHCALDVALLDLEGRRCGAQVARLLTARPAQTVEVNAVVGGGTTDEAVTFAREAAVAGYRVVKLKVGSADIVADVAKVAAVRRSCPDVTIRLDANGVWTEAQAHEAVTRLAPLGIELIEQPVRAAAVGALGRLRRAGLVPIAADEAMADPVAAGRVIDDGAADRVVLKPMRLGGLRPSLEIAQRAAERGIPAFVTTTFDSSVGTAAALHLAAALGRGRPADGLSTGEHLADDLVARPLVPRRGSMRVPPKPGLGIEVDGGALERLATGPWCEVRRR